MLGDERETDKLLNICHGLRKRSTDGRQLKSHDVSDNLRSALEDEKKLYKEINVSNLTTAWMPAGFAFVLDRFSDVERQVVLDVVVAPKPPVDLGVALAHVVVLERVLRRDFPHAARTHRLFLGAADV